MADLFKKHQGWLLPVIFQLAIAGVIYMHTMSVKAALVEELKTYVNKEELAIREKSHDIWAAEAVKRLDGKMDDAIKRLERIENRQRPALTR